MPDPKDLAKPRREPVVEKHEGVHTLFDEIVSLLMSGVQSIAENKAHVSVVKEKIIKTWTSATEDERNEFATRIYEAFNRVSISLESLKQEITIATVKQRQRIPEE